MGKCDKTSDFSPSKLKPWLFAADCGIFGMFVISGMCMCTDNLQEVQRQILLQKDKRESAVANRLIRQKRNRIKNDHLETRTGCLSPVAAQHRSIGGPARTDQDGVRTVHGLIELNQH